MSDLHKVPAPGQVWVCGACGRLGRGKRRDMGDTSCVTWAVLCEEASVVMGPHGMAIKADAVKEPA